jgi:hypothetical protein
MYNFMLNNVDVTSLITNCVLNAKIRLNSAHAFWVFFEWMKQFKVFIMMGT